MIIVYTTNFDKLYPHQYKMVRHEFISYDTSNYILKSSKLQYASSNISKTKLLGYFN